MPRVVLELPEVFDFSTELEVRVSEINYGHHVGNDRMVTMIHQARLLFLQKHGFGEFDIGGLGIAVSDLAVVFKAEAFLGETLIFDVALADFNKYGCDMYYRVTKKGEGTLVAEAKTGIVFFDYETRKIAKTPEIFLETCG